jgi:hypothetical protein
MSRSAPRRVLVVATRAAACPELVAELRERARQAPTTFSVVVPATPSGWAWLADMFSGGNDAEEYLSAAIAQYRAAGLDLESARVGDPDPVAAVMDAVNADAFDEVVVSTLPRRLAKLLRLSLAHRVEASTGRAVTHVSGTQSQTGRAGRAIGLGDARALLAAQGS